MSSSKSFQRLSAAPAEPTVARIEFGLRIWSAVCCAAAVSLAAWAAAFNPRIHLVPLGILALTVVIAEHRDRLFGDETSVSGTIVVAMAAVVAFSDGAWLLGPMICGAMAGIYWPHLRRRAWSRCAINTASMALAAGAAAAVFHASGGTVSHINVAWLLAGFGSVLTFWVVNSAVLGVAVGIIQRRRLLDVCLQLVRSDTGLLPFAALGLVTGEIFLKVDPLAGWALLIALLLVLDVVVIRQAGRAFIRSFAFGTVALVSATLALSFSAANAHPSIPLAVVAVGVLGAAGAQFLKSLDGGSFAVVLATVSASVLLEPSHSILVPAAIGLAVACPLFLERRTWPARIASLEAPRSALVAAAGSMALLRGEVGSLPGDLVAGVVAGVVALLVWHAVLLGQVVVSSSVDSWPAAADVVRSDLATFACGGVVGAFVGWVGLEFGVGALAAATLPVSCCVPSCCDSAFDGVSRRRTSWMRTTSWMSSAVPSSICQRRGCPTVRSA